MRVYSPPDLLTLRIVRGLGPKGIPQAWLGAEIRPLFGLKMPDLRPMIAVQGSRPVMLRRVVLIAGVIAIGLALNGCTKCGPIWDDWMQSPKSCKSDRL